MKTLVQGNYYTVEELLGFLSDNYRQNVFLQTVSKINLITLPRSEKLIITEIQTVYLHRMSCNSPDSYLIDDEYKVYRITQDSKGNF